MRISVICAILGLAIASATAGSRPKAREHYEKGLAELRDANFKQAAKEFRKAVKEDSRWADAHFQLAMAYLTLEKFKDAEKSNHRALELDASLDDARFWAEFFSDRRRLSECVKHADRGRFDLAAEPLRRFLEEGGALESFYEVFRFARLDPFPVVWWLLSSLEGDLIPLVRAGASNPVPDAGELALKNARRRTLRESIWAAWAWLEPERSLYYRFKQAESAWYHAADKDRGLSGVESLLGEPPEAELTLLVYRGLFLIWKGEEERARGLYDQLVRMMKDRRNLILAGGARQFVEHFGGAYEFAAPSPDTSCLAQVSLRFSDIVLSGGALKGRWQDGSVRGHQVVGGVVDLDGSLRGAHVLSGLGHGLDEMFRTEVKNCRFKPARINGVPIRQYLQYVPEYNVSFYRPPRNGED